jgi:predicted  nucleic acid-binding Zn-ribbon protein
MALSHEVVSQFAKLVDNQPKKDEGVTVKGTYKMIGDVEYVQLDGSDVLTPVESTVEAKTGERVQVLIKDHFATVTGNISSPAARNKDVKDLADTVDEQGNTIQQMDNTIIQQGNSIIQMNTTINQHETTINQHDTKINQQGDQIVSINNTVIAQGNSIEANHNAIIAQGNEIDSMNNTITSHGNSITSMNNTLQQHDNRITQNSNTITQQGNTITQQGNRITEIDNTVQTQGNTIVAQGNTIDAHGTQLTTHNSQITILNSGFVIQDGVLTGLSTAVINNLKSNTLDTGYAKIDFANIQMAAVQKLFADSGIIKDLVVQEGSITGELVGVTLKGDLIEGNTIVADKLVIKGSDGLYYKLNTNGETIESSQTSENSLNGQVIAARSITASKIQVTDLVAFGATIGGFDITDSSINTHLKTSIDSSTNGIYLDSDGQMAIGNDINHIKYYKDENNNFILDVRLDKLYLGSSQQTADQQFQGMVEISANNLTSIFKTSGGSNLLRNSVGYAGTDFWLTTGTITTNQNDDMSLSGSELILTNDASLEQIYSTQPGTLYSIAFKYKHTVVGSANQVKVEITGNGNTKTILDTTEAKSEWTTVTLDEPYEATTNSPKIIISCAGDDILEITDLIISQGTNDVWSGYIDEVYGKKHQLDANGLRLYSETSNRSTNTTSTSYQLKDGSNVIGELTRERVYSQMGEFDQGTKIGRLRTVVLDNNNIIEYI